MEKTGNRGGLKLVLGIIILIAAIVCLVIALSSCNSDDSGKDVAEENPPVSDKADDGDTADDTDVDDDTATGSSGNATGGNGSNGSTGSDSGNDSADTRPTVGSGASLEEWIAYLKNYDDNVENGVEGATDTFTDMIDQVGDKMENGNYGEGFDQFGSGLKDYIGGLVGSLTP